MISTSLTKKVLLAALLVSVMPSSASAARIYFDRPTQLVHAGDTIVVTVRIDTEQEPINVVEGTLMLNSSAAEFKELSTAGSAFSLWPRTPSLTGTSSISFTGGTPGGSTAPDAVLFKIILLAKNAGNISIDPEHLAAYINDGKGTLASVRGSPVTITVQKALVGEKPRDEWTTLVAGDTVAPKPFSISMGKDDALFNGQEFISFNAIDAGSGIDHYDVAEGGLPVVRSNTTYVLRNQHTSESITVTAYDTAGNIRVATFHTPPDAFGGTLAVISVVVMLLGIVYWRYRHFIRQRE